MTLRTLNYGNYGIFLIMGNAGFCPSTVVLVLVRVRLRVRVRVLVLVVVVVPHSGRECNLFNRIRAIKSLGFRVQGLGFRASGLSTLTTIHLYDWSMTNLSVSKQLTYDGSLTHCTRKVDPPVSITFVLAGLRRRKPVHGAMTQEACDDKDKTITIRKQQIK